MTLFPPKCCTAPLNSISSMFCVSNQMIRDNSGLDPLERCHLHQEREFALVRSKLSRSVCAHLSVALMLNRDDSLNGGKWTLLYMELLLAWQRDAS